ncbi:MAG: NAD(P)H-dependent oxidoreductase [Alphaproteobacteria bacterium]
MRIHLVYAHPLPTSFAASACSAVYKALVGAGHEVDLLDLYQEDFEPRLSAQERARYHEAPDNADGVASHVQRLRAAEGLVLVFPTWNFGPPAILKGWMDRVLLPGVAFRLDDGNIRPALTNIRHFSVVTSYGQRGWIVRWVIGDPLRKQFMRSLRRCMHPRARTRWLPLYDMNRIGDAERRLFLERLDSTYRHL